MFEIDMKEELEKFYRDKERFRNLKKMIDFDFGEKECKGKGIEMNKPKF